jgi:hypothetical protein
MKIDPYAYVRYTNGFELEKIKSAKSVDITLGSIPSFGFPEIKGNKVKNKHLHEFIKDSDLTDIMNIDQNGKESNNRTIKTVSQLKKVIDEVYRKLDIKCNNIWNNKPNSWFYVNFFKSEYYKKNLYLNNGKYKNPDLSDINYLNITETPYIKIFSNSFNGCSVNQISKLNNFRKSILVMIITDSYI